MRSNEAIIESEISRLNFVFGRAGKGEAGVIAMYEFAQQGYNVYRSCRKGEVRKKYGREYKRELIVSAWFFRGVLGNGNKRKRPEGS